MGIPRSSHNPITFRPLARITPTIITKNKRMNKFRKWGLMGCFAVTFVAQAQFSNIPLMEPEHGPDRDYVWHKPSGENQLRTTNCGVDTVYYTAAKATTQKIKILVKDGTYASSYGQLFGLSQSLSLNGFVWYGYSHDPSGTTNPIINVDCSVYAVSGGLPTGAPLASTTIAVDSSSSNARHEAIFASPVSLTAKYMIVISHTQTDLLYVLSNDENVADGAGENLSVCYYDPGSAWFKNLSLWGLGDFDLLMHPIVSYSIDANFTTPSGSQGCVGAVIDFPNTSSWILDSRFYSSAVQAGGQPSWHWDYGDGNTDAYTEHGQNTYAVAGTYNITLYDTIYRWTSGMCADSETKTIDIYDIPAAPASVPPAIVCEGTPTADLTAAGSGGTITWYSNVGLTSVIGTGSPFSSGISGPAPSATVYVTETLNGCESPATTVVIPFDSNPVPTFTPNNTGGTSYDFNGAPLASTYAWDFGDGIGTASIQTPSYTYAGGGSYNVCLDVIYANGCTNQYCSTVNIVGIAEYDAGNRVSLYPNPANDGFYLESNYLFKNVQVTVYDLVGNIVLLETIKNEKQRFIDTSDLSSGTYFLTINYLNEGTISKKLVISR